MLGKLISVAVVSDKQVEVTFDDGHVAKLDLGSIISARKNLMPLRDPAEFANVRVSGDGWALEWPSGIDFGAPQLRRWADEQSGETMPAELFLTWMTKQALSEERAAQALGLPRATITDYLSGAKPIPKTVLLATEGYAARHVA